MVQSLHMAFVPSSIARLCNILTKSLQKQPFEPAYQYLVTRPFALRLSERRGSGARVPSGPFRPPAVSILLRAN